jgi:DNA-binding MarR family transcriptional regulator
MHRDSLLARRVAVSLPTLGKSKRAPAHCRSQYWCVFLQHWLKYSTHVFPKMAKKRPNEQKKHQLLTWNNSCSCKTINPLLQPMPTLADSALEIIRLGLWNHRIQNALAKQASLPVYELECVLVLYLDRPTSASSLADLLEVRSSSLSKLLRRLEGRGLVERTVDRSDRRVEHITLAAAGISLAERSMQRAAEIAATMLDALPSERRLQFLECVQLITSSKIPEDPQFHPNHNEPFD